MSEWIVKAHGDSGVAKESMFRSTEGGVRKMIAKDIVRGGWGTWQEGQRFARSVPIPGVKGFKPGRIYEVTRDV